MKKFISPISLVFSICFLLVCQPKKTDNFPLLALLFLASQQQGCPTATTSNDPLFSSQWHLQNTGQTSGAVAGNDINTTPVWNSGNQGSGVNVVVLDDGANLQHEDLCQNTLYSLNKDYTGQIPNQVPGASQINPFPYSCDDQPIACHGTAVSGLIAARDSNGVGGRGGAPRASIGSRNILMNATSTNIADGTALNASNVFISNNSWGATDSTGDLDASLASSTWQSAIQTGVTTGRNNLGTAFFWAAGNGGLLSPSSNFANLEIDDSNYDGQANYRSVIAVAAIGNDGRRAYYSEQGANVLITAPSLGNNGVGIVTTDIMGNLGYNQTGTSQTDPVEISNLNYTQNFSGTSAATPIAAGVGALVLSANPRLTWRDLKLILALSARRVDSSDADWQTNGAGIAFNHKYGFGLVNAQAAVNLASSWSNVGSLITSTSYTGATVSAPTNYTIANNYSSGLVNLNSSPPTGLNVQSGTAIVSSSGIGRIEFVDVTVSSTISSGDHGDLYIQLQSPSGTVARLARPRPCLDFSGSTIRELRCSTYSNWRFGINTFLNETADGTWTLRISDGANGSNAFRFSSSVNTSSSTHSNATTGISWRMTIYGRAN